MLRCETEFFGLFQSTCFMAKAELAIRTPRRFAFTVRNRGAEQVLECGRASAAFPLAPTVIFSNLYTILMLFRAQASASKNTVSHPWRWGKE